MAPGRAVAEPAVPGVLAPQPGAGEPGPVVAPAVPEPVALAVPEPAVRKPAEPELAGPAAQVRAARALV